MHLTPGAPARPVYHDCPVRCDLANAEPRLASVRPAQAGRSDPQTSRMLLSCGADPGSRSRHSASGVSLSVIGQGTLPPRRGKRLTTKSPRHTKTPSSSLVFLVVLGDLVVFVVGPPVTARRPPGGVGWVAFLSRSPTAPSRSVVGPRRCRRRPLPIVPTSPGRRPIRRNGARSHDPQPPGVGRQIRSTDPPNRLLPL